MPQDREAPVRAIAAPPLSRRVKRTLLGCVSVALALAACEVGSMLFFHLRRDRFTFADTAQYLLDDAAIERVGASFDAGLGWKERFETRFGERPSSISHARTLVATFGDSYTFCDEVQDEETWQVALAELAGENVLNFGNGAYGIDQSLLRFREDYPKVKTPLVTLGLITENINRVVNVYRKFYVTTTGIPATKPRFHRRDGRLVLVENPIKSVGELHKLKDPDFLLRIGREDYWFNINNRPYFAFPYTALFLDGRIWQEIIHGKSGDRISETALSKINPWYDQSIRELFFAILDRFILEAREQGAMPLITLMPMEFEVVNRIRSGANPHEIELVLAYCRDRRYPVFCPLDDLARAYLQNPDQQLFTPGGHYSALANRIVAEGLHRQLADMR